MIPYLIVQSNGIGVLNGDNFNTFVQGGCLLANLQAFTGLPNMTVYLIGFNAPGDGGQGAFYWNASWTGTPDNQNSIQPYGVYVGAWLRLPAGAGSNGILRNAATAVTDTMTSSDGVIIWNQAGTATRNQTLLAASTVPNNYRVTVKDGFGDSAVYNIVIVAAGGTIDGGPSATINVRKGALTFAANNLANDWTII
jgi:hypothetical protein